MQHMPHRTQRVLISILIDAIMQQIHAVSTVESMCRLLDRTSRGVLFRSDLCSKQDRRVLGDTQMDQARLDLANSKGI